MVANHRGVGHQCSVASRTLVHGKLFAVFAVLTVVGMLAHASRMGHTAVNPDHHMKQRVKAAFLRVVEAVVKGLGRVSNPREFLQNGM